MLTPPKYRVGDKIRYTAGKRGYHRGLEPNQIFTAVEITPPINFPNRKYRRGEWGGWAVNINATNMFFPASWFKFEACGEHDWVIESGKKICNTCEHICCSGARFAVPNKEG